MRDLTHDEYYTAVGRALSRWSNVEHAIEMMFVLASMSRSPLMADAFWAVVSFEARLSMTDALMENFKLAWPDDYAKWILHRDRAMQLKKTRNDLAHGTVTGVGRAYADGTQKSATIFAPHWPKQLRDVLKDEEWARKHAMKPKHWMSVKAIDTFGVECGQLASNLTNLYTTIQPKLREALSQQSTAESPQSDAE